MRPTSDIENQFQLRLRFIFSSGTPPLFSKILFFVFFLLLPCLLSAKTKTLHYSGQTYELYVSQEKELFAVGPWEDGSTWIAADVQDVWGGATEFGLVLGYQTLDGLYWAVVDKETGEKRAGGFLREISPEDGMIQFLTVSPKVDKAIIKVQFETGNFVVYLVDIHGRKKILREGKSGKS